MYRSEFEKEVVTTILLFLGNYDCVDYVCVSNGLLTSLQCGELSGDVYVDRFDDEELLKLHYKLTEIYGEEGNLIYLQKTDFDYDINNIPQYSLKKMKANKVPPFDK